MPTSEDIAGKKELIARAEAAKAAASVSDTACSVNTVSDTTSVQTNADRTAAKPAEQASGSALSLIPRSSLDKTYYIIVGAFKTDELVAASLKQHEGILGPPFAFLGNGLKYVAIGGYDTLEEARKALVQAHTKAPEAWVYKKR